MVEQKDKAAAAPICPPHHWLIEGQQGWQRWTCYRCGVEHTQREPSPDERPGWLQAKSRRARAPQTESVGQQ